MEGRPGERLRELDRDLTLLSHSAAVLGWDQETYMPSRAVGERSEQLALLQGLLHDRLVSDELGGLLEQAGSADGPAAAAPGLVRLLGRRRERSLKLPRSLVMRQAQTASRAQAAWAEAREKSSFSLFTPHLGELVEISREIADRIGYTDHPYDALLDEYEPWMKTGALSRLFESLARELVPFVEKLKGARRPDDSFLRGDYPPEAQEAFGRRLLAELGFEAERGRLDVSAHPFSTTLGRDDVRITTRYNRGNLLAGLFGIIHECGHALYELGFGPEIATTSLANGTSMGIHESQSRFWENMVGRGLPFWRRFYGALRAQFPGRLDGVPLEEFQRAINKVEASLIRVEADEVTYNLYIILRFRLELELVSGGLSVGDLPRAWNEASRELLGLVPPDDAQGVLQDIHWSMGGIGYFPTYTLGNLYAAQFASALRRDLPDFDGLVEQGRFDLILAWLRRSIHRHGSALTAEEICVQATGRPLSVEPYMQYLRSKYSGLYGL